MILFCVECSQPVDWVPDEGWTAENPCETQNHHKPVKNEWHAHIDWESRDCDGRYNGGSYFRQHDRYEWDELHTLIDLLIIDIRKTPYWPGEHTDLRIINASDDYRMAYRFYTSAATDEGYEAIEARICRDPSCDFDDPEYFRDHTAEAAGY